MPLGDAGHTVPLTHGHTRRGRRLATRRFGGPSLTLDTRTGPVVEDPFTGR